MAQFITASTTVTAAATAAPLATHEGYFRYWNIEMYNGTILVKSK